MGLSGISTTASDGEIGRLAMHLSVQISVHRPVHSLAHESSQQRELERTDTTLIVLPGQDNNQEHNS